MKLIIDIPDNIYYAIKITQPFISGQISGKTYLQILVNSVQNGTPLDDVKTEIEKQIERDFAFSETETLKVPCHYGIANGLQNAIRFLDNIGKAESEKENVEKPRETK